MFMSLWTDQPIQNGVFVTGSSRNGEQKNRVSLMVEALKNLAK